MVADALCGLRSSSNDDGKAMKTKNGGK